MYTREEYIKGVCTHQEYYAQLVDSSTKGLIMSTFSLSELRSAGKNFSGIPLKHWVRMANCFDEVIINRKMKPLGDYPTQAGKVCILKEAARQLIDLGE